MSLTVVMETLDSRGFTRIPKADCGGRGAATRRVGGKRLCGSWDRSGGGSPRIWMRPISELNSVSPAGLD